MSYALRLRRWKKSFQSPNARLQDILKTTRSHRIQACRNTWINNIRHTATTTATQPWQRSNSRIAKLRKPRQRGIYPIKRTHSHDYPASAQVEKEQKSISTHVNLAITSPPTTTEYLSWSYQTVGFNRVGHPRKVPRPGHTHLWYWKRKLEDTTSEESSWMQAGE
jgi:hypothetical protein